MLAGIDPIRPEQKCLGINNGKIGPVDSTGGVVSVLGGFITMTFDIPVHTGDYVKYMAGNFGVAKPTYAANGTGLDSLSPIIPIWTTFRNITYLLFVLLFVIIGFAIMLRVHIDPRTVMTIENQIPKIIISLILVTFSIAIAGFLIDLMYIFIYLVVNVFAAIPDNPINLAIARSSNPIEAGNYLSKGFGGFASLAGTGAGSVAPFFAPIFDNDLGRLVMGGFTTMLVKFGLADFLSSMVLTAYGAVSVALAAPTAGASLVIAPIAGLSIKVLTEALISLTGGLIGATFAPQFAQGIGFLLTFLVLFIAIIWALIRLWFALLKAYIMILIDIVFAPFWILLGGVPGSRLSFEAWLRDIGSNLLAFPAAITMFLLAVTFMNLFAQRKEDIFVPPLIGNPAGAAIGSLVGIGILLLTPSVVDMMRKALKAPEFDLSTIFAAIGVGTGAPGGILGQAGQLGMQFQYMQHVPGLSTIARRLGRQPQTFGEQGGGQR